ncbi:MAG: hypothetical protein GY854_32055 [Deltaproteobacteria bacterium]|nr:hypothetical protein [Deltaproteobacteria bacterium]
MSTGDVKKSSRSPIFSLRYLFFVVIGVAVCALVYFTKSEPAVKPYPLNQIEHDCIRGTFAALTMVGLFVVLIVRSLESSELKHRLQLVLKAGAVILVVLASVMYFYSARGLTRRHYLNFHDLYHYFLGCKYYHEVEYNNFYACHLQADREKSKPRFRERDKVRDLNTYKKSRVKNIRESADCSSFSEERWDEFKRDTDVFGKHSSRRIILDHGYNGTPFSAFIAGGVAQLPEVNYQNLIFVTFIDILGLCILFAVVQWGFGWRIAFLFALFLMVNFADFYFHVSFFRYLWMVTLGIGLACLNKEKYGLSAVFLTASAMLNVFPLLFFAGIGLKLVYSLIKERTLKPRYRTFVVWAVIATIFFGGLSLMHERPIDRYKTFFSNMGMHSGLLTSTRTGFRYNFMFKGELTKEHPRYSYAEKKRDFEEIQIPYNIVVGLILILGAMLVLRLDDFRATVLAGFLLLFMLFSTVVYYYACASVLVLLWAKDINRKRGVGLIALLFGLMVVPYVLWWQTEYRMFINNTVLTAVFTLYLLVTFCYFIKETRLFSRDA